MGMEMKAAALLGEPVILAPIVGSKGVVRRMAAAGAVGGPVGLAPEKVIRPDGERSPDQYRGFMTMALTPTRLAFIEFRQGYFRSSLGKVLATYSRTSIAGCEVGGGALASSVTLRFIDGSSFTLEASIVQRGKARRIAAELAGP